MIDIDVDTLTDRQKRELKAKILIEKKKRACNRSHLEFMKFHWLRKEEFKIGLHTRKICTIIDDAINKYREGRSSYICVKAPPRQGKSDLVSRYLPANFISQFPDEEIINTSYSASLSYTFSKFTRKLIQSENFQLLYQHIQLARQDRSVAEWGLEGYHGKANYSGLGGSLTGKGGSLIIVDDFTKNRAEAESEVYRDKIAEGFFDDVLTRAAPVAIVILLATSWHEDDLYGRIKQKMATDKNFPKFEFHNFPAMSNEYPEGILFPERFNREWYEAKKAASGTYGWASLFMGDPIPREGSIFKTDGVKIISQFPAGLSYVRGWDLASSEKERLKDDPDYTVGIKLAVRRIPTAIEGVFTHQIFIAHMARIQKEATARNKLIQDTAISDGPNVKVAIEAFSGQKDTYTQLKEILMGIRSVSKSNMPGDKVVKASPMEQIFEGGNVFLLKADWNDEFIKEFKVFPKNGKHDDIVDATAVAFHEATNRVELKSFQINL